MAATSLAPDELVYRALLRKQWIDPDTRQVKPEAFLLRSCKDHDGLSVLRACCCGPEECASRFNPCYGLGELKVGSVRNLDGLDVIHREDASRQTSSRKGWMSQAVQASLRARGTMKALCSSAYNAGESTGSCSRTK